VDHRSRALIPGVAGAAWCFLRHGESEDNAAGRLSDDPEVALSPRGADEARAAGAALRTVRFARVLCSPLRRARDTAAEVVPRLPPGAQLSWPGWLAERRLGALCGANLPPEAERWRLGWFDAPPGGESQAEVLARVRAGLGALGPEEGRTLVIAHAGVIRAWLGWIDGVPDGSRGSLRVPRATPLWRPRAEPAAADALPRPG
jgi:broad specificity phosphatase PhoE